MNEFNQYKRKGLSEMRSYVKGEDLSKISVSDTDDPENDMGMVARNPKDHNDQWYVAKKYFEDNLELIEEDAPDITITVSFTQQEIESLQSKVHSITGDGEVMECFNKLLGNQAG